MSGKTAVSAALAAAVAAAVSFRILVNLLGKKTYDGLSGVISFSSKMIAAARAVESAEEHPLVVDPLAEKLAGPTALAASRKRAAPAPKDSERRFKLGKMAIRTRWVDDQIAATLGMPVADTIPAALRDPGAALRIDQASYVWSGPGGQKPRQLVMLGAGMDSRPWRMKLPADLHWFELDRGDVLEAKKAELRALGVEVPLVSSLAEDDAMASPLSPLSPKSVDSGLARHTSLDSVQFPLRCGFWAAVSCDLADPAWTEALLAAGFDPRKPTVWVAEGLLMYLEEGAVRSLLSQIAELSAEGSVFVGLSVTRAVIDRIQSGASKTELMSTWKFGCPADPTQFMSECGWQLQLATDRARQAAALGLDPTLCSFPAGGAFFAEAGGSDKGASLFLVATNRAGAA